MEDKIEIGEYVRTNQGDIFKFGGYFKKGIINTMTDEYGILYGNQEKICKKHSKNIIDLIEEGDYVNGSKVEKYKFSTNLVTKERYIVINDNWYLYDWNIKSIVTKEQFNSIKYKIPEEK